MGISFGVCSFVQNKGTVFIRLIMTVWKKIRKFFACSRITSINQSQFPI